MGEKLYTIGEFAELTGVNRQTLIWYEKIELFTPILIKENGYRFYSMAQFDLFMVIRSLSTLGLSLTEIKAVIDHKTKDEIDVLLKEHIADIDQQLTQLQNLKKSLMQWSDRIETMDQINLDEITIETHDQKDMLLSKSFEGLTEKDRSREILQLANFRYETRQFGEYLGGIVSRENFDVDKTSYSYYFTAPSEHNVNGHQAAGEYVVAYHVGDYRETYKSYQRIKDFAKENQIELGEWVYEQSLVDDKFVSNSEEHVIRISIPIITS